VPKDLARTKPHLVQQLAPREEAQRKGTLEGPPDYDLLAHCWVPSIITRPMTCFEQPESVDLILKGVRDAVESSDGVALDGLGFRNHYACWCERCDARRAKVAEEEGLDVYDALARASEDLLVEISEKVYEAAKSVNHDAIVMNHRWPPFKPNPYYGWRLRMDYCSQTVSWFYKPHWSLERVQSEIEEMLRLEDRERNQFIPFIGCYADAHNVRSGDRIATELDLAQSQCGDHLVFCNLEAPKRHRSIAEALVTHLR